MADMLAFLCPPLLAVGSYCSANGESERTRILPALTLSAWQCRVQATGYWRQNCNLEELCLSVSPYPSRSHLDNVLGLPLRVSIAVPSTCADMLLFCLQQCHSHGGSILAMHHPASCLHEQANICNPSFTSVSYLCTQAGALPVCSVRHRT